MCHALRCAFIDCICASLRLNKVSLLTLNYDFVMGNQDNRKRNRF